MVSLHFLRPLARRLRRDLAAADRYPLQRQLASSMEFRRRLPNGQWSTQMVELSAAAAPTQTVQWAE